MAWCPKFRPSQRTKSCHTHCRERPLPRCRMDRLHRGPHCRCRLDKKLVAGKRKTRHQKETRRGVEELAPGCSVFRFSSGWKEQLAVIIARDPRSTTNGD